MKRVIGLLLAPLVVLLVAADCGGFGGDAPPSTRIAVFEASATSVVRGEAVTLTWEIERAGSADGVPSCSLGRRAENEDALELLVVDCSGSLTEVPEAPATSSFFRYQLNALKRPLDAADPYVTSVITVVLEDPPFVTQASGTGFDAANDVSALSDGGAMVAGSFTGTTSFGSASLTSAGAADVFVARVNVDGSWVWATRGGGPDGAAARGVSALADGGAVVAGAFVGTASFGDADLTSSSIFSDVFVARVNANGTWGWAARAGGTAFDVAEATGVSALGDGGAIVTGFFDGTISFGATALTSADGSSDVFVARVDGDGSWVWAARAGGSALDAAWGVSAFGDGSAIVVGGFNGSASFGGSTLTSAGSDDVFVARVGADGSWVWAARAGGTAVDQARGVSVVSDGGAIVTGRFTGTASFGGSTLTSAGSDDVFVARVGADGSWVWATSAGGSSFDQAWDVSALSDGSAIVVGYIFGTASFGGTSLTSAGGGDAFVARVSANGTWEWAVRGGGPAVDQALGVSASGDGGAFVAGSFEGTASFGGVALSSAGERNAFVARVGSGGAW